MDAVVHGDAEQVAPALGKGEPQQSHGLDVSHRVGAGIFGGKQGAGLAGGQWLRGKNDDGPPLGWGRDASHMHLPALAGAGNKSAQPAGCCIVRVSLQRAGLFDDALGTPIKLAKVHRQGDGCQPASRRRAAAHGQRNAIGYANSKRDHRPPMTPKQVLVGFQDEVVLCPGTTLPVTARGGNRELSGRFGIDFQIEIEGHGGGVKSRAEVGGGCGKAQPETPGICSCSVVHPALPFIVASTAAGEASTATALRRNASISASRPTVSSFFKRVPRWKSMV